MLALIKDQIGQIRSARQEAVVIAITDWLIDEFPTEGADRGAVLGEVRSVAETAWNWGVESGELVRLHVYAAKVLGRDYPIEFPVIGSVLADRGLTDDIKLAWFAGWIDAYKRLANEAP